MSSEALRNTLDHLAMDPEAGADRHYLATVLRRLGYSDRQIQEVLGTAEEGRVIEVEYSGPTTTSFEFGAPGTAEEAAAAIQQGKGALQFKVSGGEEGAMQFKLASDPEAGEEVFDAVDLEEGDITDDWADDWSDEEFTTSDDDFSDSDGGDDGFEGEEGEEVEFKPIQLVQFTAAGASAMAPANPALDAGWIPVDQDAEEYLVDDAPGDAWQPAEDGEPTWEAMEGDEVAAWSSPFEDVPDTEGDPMWQASPDDEPWEAEEPQPGVYRHGEFTLYERDVELTTGRTQKIYFFAKTDPKSGEPCALPDGYEVGVNEKTGLPFLRKTGTEEEKHQCGALTQSGKQCRLTAQAASLYCHLHEDYHPDDGDDVLDTAPVGSQVRDTEPTPSTGRTRTTRVQASSPEEAERLIKERGGRVKSVVPIRFEEDE